MTYNILNAMKAILILVLMISSCTVSTQIVKLNSSEESVKLFTNIPVPDTSYTEIAQVELTGGIFAKREKLRQKLITLALQNNCNAVINVKFKTTFLWPQAYGTMIKYSND